MHVQFSREKRHFDRFTAPAMRVIALAQEESRRLKHGFVASEQILIGLLLEEKGIAAQILRSLGVELSEVRLRVEKLIGIGSNYMEDPPFTGRGLRIVRLACYEADQLNSSKVDTEHLLLGLIREEGHVASRILGELEIDSNNIRLGVMGKLRESSA